MHIIDSDVEKCVGCNRCVRECPVETANLTYQDGDGNIKVRTASEYCIGCGMCIDVCEHDARFYTDDADRFFKDLAAGKKIIVITAPSLKANYPKWPRLLKLLRDMGAARIYDISFGADICIWGHVRYIEANPGQPLITQPCPAIVSYIVTHHPELLPYLSPVNSPMGCLTAYIRKYLGDSTALAAITPCIAKKIENDANGGAEYSITFKKLAKYIDSHGIALPGEASGFDGVPAGLGSLFPIPGGLMENLRFFTGESLRIDAAEGNEAYKALEEYAGTRKRFLPDVFDVLNCTGGCAIGTGCIGGQNMFEVNTKFSKTRKKETAGAASARHLDMLRVYDDTLKLGDFLRTHKASDTPAPKVTDADIQKAFRLLGKENYVQQNFNCGACGSNSCLDMARKVALGVNIPISCIVKSRDDAEHGHERIERYLKNVHDIVENLHSIGADGTFGDVVIQSLRTMYESVGNVDSTSVWHCTPDAGSGSGYSIERLYAWFGDSDISISGIRGAWPEEWIQALQHGEPVILDRKSVPPKERKVFPPNAMALLMIPIIIHEEFWGFITMASRRKVSIAQEDISIIKVCGLLIVSSIIEYGMAESLRTAQAEAVSANAAKSNFLFSMSHEIRTPLNAVIGMTNVARNTDDPERRGYCLEVIDNSSKHLLSLINNVLDMSKIESGKVELDLEPFDVRRMLLGVESIVSVKAGEKKQNLLFETDPGLRQRYIGDAMKLSQIITNLLGNAVKFTPEGGVVKLVTREVKGRAQADDTGMGRLRFEAIDTGIGITDEQRSRLFKPFEQAEAGITKQYGGTGLGLAISKGLVERMGGFIDVVSKPGKGTTFFFEVELGYAEAKEEEPPEAAAAGVKPADISGMKLLLVEDMDINREIFVSLLENTGAEIDEAANGKEAFAMYKAAPEKYDVIVMDIQMPVMDGYTATREIRGSGLPGSKTIPVIAMTANVFQEDIDHGRAAGMNAHLAKPIDLKTLISTLARFSGRGRY